MRKLGEQWVEVIDGKKHMLKCTGFADDMSIIINDLGILNEDGCSPNCWGEYPRIEERVDVHTKEHWFRCITRNNVYCATDSYKTKQEAIDEWNKRA